MNAEAAWLISGDPGYSARKSWRGAKLYTKQCRGGCQMFYGWASDRTYVGQFSALRQAVNAARWAINAELRDTALFFRFATGRAHG